MQNLSHKERQNEMLDELLKHASTLIVGVIVGVAGTLASGYAKEYFDERARQRKHKIHVANEVHKVVNEALAGKYTVRPRDLEHVQIVQTDVSGVDAEIGKVFADFVELWKNMSMPHLPRSVMFHKMTEWNKEIHEKRLILNNWTNKIRTGK